MMGRPRVPGTAAERAERRRTMVRANVQAHRRKKRQDKGASTSDDIRRNEVTTTLEINSTDKELRLKQTLETTSHRWILQPPFRLCLGDLYRDAFVSALSRRCHMPDIQDPGTRSDVHVNVCCGIWVESVCVQSQGDPGIISNALLTTALTLAGSINRNESMLRVAVQMENELLASLRQILHRWSRLQPGLHDLRRMITTILILAVANLIVKKSWTSFGIHLTGVAALIKSAGPEAVLNSTSALDQFFAFRAVQLPFAFLTRERSFLSQTEWIGFSGRQQVRHDVESLQNLIDVLYQIPSLMQDFDSALCRGALSVDLPLLLKKCRGVEILIDGWQQESQLLFAWSSSAMARPINLTEFDTSGNMALPGTLMANISSLVLGAKVGLHCLILDIIRNLVKDDTGNETAFELNTAIDQTRVWSARAIRCVNSFRQLEPHTTGKLVCLFPFDMAWSTYHILNSKHNVACSEDIRHCEELAREFEATGLPALRVFRRRHTQVGVNID